MGLPSRGCVEQAVLIPEFALYDGLEPQHFVGMLAGGTTLTLLGLYSAALWLPVDYHVNSQWCGRIAARAYSMPGAIMNVSTMQLRGPRL